MLQVSAHNCLNHLSRVESVGPKPEFLWERLFVVAGVGLLVLVHCKTEDEPQMFCVLFQRSVHTRLPVYPVSYSDHQRSPRAWILSRLWGYNPDSSPVSSHIGASFPVGLKKTCGSLQWLGMGIWSLLLNGKWLFLLTTSLTIYGFLCPSLSQYCCRILLGVDPVRAFSNPDRLFPEWLNGHQDVIILTRGSDWWVEFTGSHTVEKLEPVFICHPQIIFIKKPYFNDYTFHLLRVFYVSWAH